MTDPEAKLSYLGQVVIDNRHGLAVDAALTEANGRAEREAALEMAARLPGEGRVTLGADKGYDTRDFVEGLRELDVTPHVAQNANGRRSRIDGRTTRHAGYEKSQKKRKLVEQVFGWIKRRRAVCARRAIEAARRSAGCSPSPRRLTTWFELET